MKNIYKLLIVTLLFTACTNLDEEFYDKIPGENYPENGLQIALESAPMYRPLQDFVDGGGWWFCQEVTSDEMTVPTRDTDWDDGGKWRALHTHTWNNTTEAVAAMWGRFYEGTGKINQLLERYADAEVTAELLNVQAKQKIMRAYYYYLLIDNYGDVPYVTTFATAEQNPMKNDRAEIFNSIVQEVEENIVHLKETSSKTAVSRGMAFSLLAKLYLNAEVYTGTAMWEDAQRACDSLIAMGSYALESDPLAPFVTENSMSAENIFTIPFDKNTYKNFNLHMRTLHYNHNLTFDMTVGPWNGFCATEAHFHTFDDSDLRKEGFLYGPQYTSSGGSLMDNTAGSQVNLDPFIPALTMDATYTPQEIRMSGARVAKFEIEMGASDNLSNDFPLFRYADILLMKAEAMMRLGGSGDDLINQIRNRAGLDNISGATLEDLLAERGREMFWEAHRRQDLIRFGEFSKSWWEKAPSGPERETFPIPQWAIDSNPNLAL